MIIMPKSYLEIARQNYCHTNNQVKYPLFILHEFIEFLESIKKFQFFFTYLKLFLNVLKNERNVTNFVCFCTKIPYHTQEFF